MKKIPILDPRLVGKKSKDITRKFVSEHALPSERKDETQPGIEYATLVYSESTHFKNFNEFRIHYLKLAERLEELGATADIEISWGWNEINYKKEVEVLVPWTEVLQKKWKQQIKEYDNYHKELEQYKSLKKKFGNV